jgi:hypothetical protein
MLTRIPSLVGAALLCVPAAAQTTLQLTFSPSTKPDQFGSDVTYLGNLRGRPTMLVSAPMDSVVTAQAGRVYAFSTETGERTWSVSGTAWGQSLGTRVAALGDASGDGAPDFAVTSVTEPFAFGLVEVRSGLDAALLSTTSGALPGDALGVVLDGPGDVDGDGLGDVLAGSSTNGEIRIVSGATGGEQLSIVVPGAFQAAAVGDFDGDGHNDFAVASKSAGSRVDVLSSVGGGVLLAIGPSELQPNPFDGFGPLLDITGVTAAGDADADGFPDLAVGLPGDNTVGTNAGRISIYSGASGSEHQRILGTVPAALLGAGIEGAGDLDLDGHDDLWAHGLGEDPERLHAFSGKSGHELLQKSFFTPSGSFGFSGHGTSMDAAEDRNGDGVPDLILGDQVYRQVRVLSGATLPLHSDTDVVQYAAGTVTQDLSLDAGTAQALQPYLLLGSQSGALPGTPAGGVTLPLNVDPYLLHTLANPNQPPLTGSFGTLDANGRGSAVLTLPPGVPSLPNTTVHHAFLVFGLATGPVFASNAMPLYLYSIQ